MGRISGFLVNTADSIKDQIEYATQSYDWLALSLIIAVALAFVLIIFTIYRKRRLLIGATRQEERSGGQSGDLLANEVPAEEHATEGPDEQAVTMLPGDVTGEQHDEVELSGDEVETSAVEAPVELQKETFFERLRNRLSNTHDTLIGRIERLIARSQTLDADVYEELEEILMTADMGVRTSYELLSNLQQELAQKGYGSPEVMKQILREKIYSILSVNSSSVDCTTAKPFVMMVVGVNGVGKTTSIGKLAYKLRNGSRAVMLVAADTFRAAAIEQLEFWSKKVGADFVSQKPGSDPSAVVYDAIHAALARGTDIVIVDTAGRLHTKTNLMEELKKVKRVIGRELSGAPHEVLLVLDATTGQNAILQARTFHEALEVTGIILTKLDGTAKGGVIVGVANELRLPVRYIGIGEGLEDLTQFDAQVFLQALFN